MNKPCESSSPKELSPQARLHDVLSRAVTPENVDEYIDEALASAVEFVDNAVEDYRNEVYSVHQNRKDLEDQALQYFGVEGLEHLFDHLLTNQSVLEDIDITLKALEPTDRIIMPPDDQEFNLEPGEQGFEDKKQLPKLKTILFILSNEFEVDIHDLEQVEIELGAVTADMVRKTGYVMINIKLLDKTVLVCDEEENITFVFDNCILDEINSDHEQLQVMTKRQLKEAIAEYGLGETIKYSPNYAENIIKSLYRNSGDTTGGEFEITGAGQYLRPGGSVLTERDLADKYGVSKRTIKKVLQELQLPTFNVKRSGNSSPAISARYESWVKQHYLICTPNAEEYEATSVSSFARDNSIGRIALDELIEELKIQTGEFKFNNRHGLGVLKYDHDRLLRHPRFSYEHGDETDALSSSEVTELLSIGINTLKDIVDDLELELEEFQFGSHISEGFTQEDIIRIRQHPTVSTPAGSEYGALSMRDLAKRYDMSSTKAARVVADLGLQTGEYRFGPNASPGVLPSDLESIEAHPFLQLDIASDDLVSINGLRKQLGVTRSSIIDAATRQGVDLNEYKFASGRVKSIGFTPVQAEAIRQDERIATPEAEDYSATSINVASKELHVTKRTLREGIDQLDIRTGQFRFGPNLNEGIMHEDLETLRAHFASDSVT